MENNREAATCAICNREPGTIETLLGAACDECVNGTEHTTPAPSGYAKPIGPQLPVDAKGKGDIGPVEITHYALDL